MTRQNPICGTCRFWDGKRRGEGLCRKNDYLINALCGGCERYEPKEDDLLTCDNPRCSVTAAPDGFVTITTPALVPGNTESITICLTCLPNTADAPIIDLLNDANDDGVQNLVERRDALERYGT